MKLLSKEQAEWLIEKIKTEAQTECFTGTLNYAQTVEKILNQCAEQEFPAFTLDRGSSEYSLALRRLGDNGVYISISDPGWKNTQMSLSAEEFLQVAEGVAKIKEWLDAH